MHGIVLLLLLLFVYITTTQVITCQSEDDYYHFLYKICTRSKPCKHLFHLYPITESDAVTLLDTPERAVFMDYRNGRDFQLFRHQLSTKPIFHIAPSTLSIAQSLRTSHHVLQHTMPEEWLPTTNVVFNPAVLTPFSEDEALWNTATIRDALYGMHIYKMTVADEFFCHEPNERFLIDPLTDTSYCKCKTGKLCENDANFNSLLQFLLVFLIFGVFIFIISIFASLFYKRRLLSDISRSSINTIL